MSKNLDLFNIFKLFFGHRHYKLKHHFLFLLQYKLVTYCHNTADYIFIREQMFPLLFL